MTFNDLQTFYGRLPQAGALLKTLGDRSVRRVFLQGLVASSVPMLFASVMRKMQHRTVLFVLDDADEAGYFYNDLAPAQDLNADALTDDAHPSSLKGVKQSATTEGGKVLFFPSSYRRAVKYGQRDAANEIARTEVLTWLAARDDAQNAQGRAQACAIVTYPEALAELVGAQRHLDDRRITLRTSQTIEMTVLSASRRWTMSTNQDSLPCEAASSTSIPIAVNCLIVLTSSEMR